MGIGHHDSAAWHSDSRQRRHCGDARLDFGHWLDGARHAAKQPDDANTTIAHHDTNRAIEYWSHIRPAFKRFDNAFQCIAFCHNAFHFDTFGHVFDNSFGLAFDALRDDAFVGGNQHHEFRDQQRVDIALNALGK